MPVQRKGTPPSSVAPKRHNVLGALSAWTENDPDMVEAEDNENAKRRGQYSLLKDVSEVDAPPSTLSKLWKLFDVNSDHFNMFIGLVIILNAALIGLETEYGRETFIVFEHIFNSVFVLEMALRITQLGSKFYFKTPWYIFDSTLVITGSLDLWILPFFTGGGAEAAKGVGYKLSVMRALRVVRLMRILRVIRLFRMFQQLYLIMQAFHKAFQVVLLISILVMILNYVCGILLTQAVGQCAERWTDKHDQEDVVMWFGTIGKSMQTLFVIMTLSNWDVIVLTLIKVYPPAIVILFFVLYIMVTSYTMISLITAIITDSLVTAGQEYKRKKLQIAEDKKREILSDLQDFLAEACEEDLDAMGTVDIGDLKTYVRGDQELLMRLSNIGIMISEKGMLNLLDKLSKDGQGRVRPSYFADVLCNLHGPASASSVVDAKQEAVLLTFKLEDFEKKFDRLIARMYPEAQADFQPAPKEEPAEVVVKQGNDTAPPKRSSMKHSDDVMAPPKASISKNMRFTE